MYSVMLSGNFFHATNFFRYDWSLTEHLSKKGVEKLLLMSVLVRMDTQIIFPHFHVNIKGNFLTISCVVWDYSVSSFLWAISTACMHNSDSIYIYIYNSCQN